MTSDFYSHPVSRWLDPDTGQIISHSDLMREMASRQAVLLGETHDQFDIHRWQLAVISALHGYMENVAVGFEMFPRSAQPVLDEWGAGHLSEEDFLEKVKWKEVWGFDPELYLPIFRYCREFGLPMLALNCYRALVTRVGKEGWNAIPEEERDGLTPSKWALDAYADYLFGMVAGPDGIFLKNTEEAKARKARFIRAQQTWDRAFACNIQAFLEKNPEHLVVGIIGRGHLEYGFGTPYQLEDLGVSRVSVLLPGHDKQVDPEKVKTISRAIFRLPESFEASGERR